MRLALIITLMLCTPLAAAPGARAPARILEIHFVSDTHSNLDTIGPRTCSLEGRLGGIARLAGWLKHRRVPGKRQLFVHSGDSFMGDPLFNLTLGAAELELLSDLGCDAMCVGNHEMDLGPFALEQVLRTVNPRFQLVSANLDLSAPPVQGLRDFIKPYVVKQLNGMKVGLFGVTTPDANLISQPAPATVDPDVVAAASRAVKALQAEGCEVIICLSHCGKILDTAIARNVAGIHVILGGHDHAPLAQPLAVRNPLGATTYIAQPAPYYHEVGTVRLQVKAGTVRLLRHRKHRITARTRKDRTMDAKVKALVAAAEKVWGPLYTRQAAYVTSTFAEFLTDLRSAGPKDLPLPNLVADAYRATTGTQVAFVPGGTTAQPLYRGPITAADLFRAVGYGFNTFNGLGFRLATFKMTGAALVAGLELGLTGIEAGSDDFFAQVSGLRYTYNPNAAPTRRVVSVTVNGSPLNPAATYTVTANESIPTFLTAFGIGFSDLVVLEQVTEFQALAGYAQGRTLSPRVEGRVFCVPSP